MNIFCISETAISRFDLSDGSLGGSDTYDKGICEIDESTSEESSNSCCSYTILSPDSNASNDEQDDKEEEETAFTQVQVRMLIMVS